MDLYQEILSHVLENETVEVTFPNLQINAAEIVQMRCYQALKKIKAILEDERLDDAACCMKIEEILCVLENMGSNGGTRHDFG